MPKRASQAPARKTREDTPDNLGFEDKLWQAADVMRNMRTAEHKHAVSGLIFLKYFSDTSSGKHAEMGAATAQGVEPEDRGDYRAAASSPTARTTGTEDV